MLPDRLHPPRPRRLLRRRLPRRLRHRPRRRRLHWHQRAHSRRRPSRLRPTRRRQRPRHARRRHHLCPTEQSRLYRRSARCHPRRLPRLRLQRRDHDRAPHRRVQPGLRGRGGHHLGVHRPAVWLGRRAVVARGEQDRRQRRAVPSGCEQLGRHRHVLCVCGGGRSRCYCCVVFRQHRVSQHLLPWRGERRRR